MVDVKNKKCKCGEAQPSYNLPGEKTGICCSNCKTEDMVDVRTKKCKCGEARPTYNLPGEEIAICCKSCKTDAMINVRSKKCKCGKAQPSYNLPGEKTAICCANCKTADMVNVVTKMCKGLLAHATNGHGDLPCGSGVTPPHVGNVRYRGWCTECFRINFPTDPLTFQIRSKTKEIAVRDYINCVFEGFEHNTRLCTGHCDCTVKRLIDHRRLIGNTLLVVETDENQHKSYNAMDEETRYDDLFMAHSGRWIYMRFNPDSYRDQSGKKRNPELAGRLRRLGSEIEKQMGRIEREEHCQTEMVERIYLYYDGYTV